MGDQSFLLLDRVRQSGHRAVLATVVRSVGPTYRKPGASAVIVEQGEVLGAVSGGCLESDLIEAAQGIFAGGPPRLLDYDSGDEADLLWGTGSGCGGRVHILLAAVPDSLLAELVTRLERGESAVVSTVITTGDQLGRRSLDTAAPGVTPWWYSQDGSMFRQLVEPPATLVVCGAGNDVQPVVALAATAGFRVTVVDHRPVWATATRFPNAHRVECAEPEELAGRLQPPSGSFALIMNHHYERDLRYMEVLLDQPMAAVGLLGARDRSHHLLSQLLERRPDLTASAAQRLRAPVGLDIGADGPQEIACAIVAELLMIRAGRSGVPLRSVTPAATGRLT